MDAAVQARSSSRFSPPKPSARHRLGIPAARGTSQNDAYHGGERAGGARHVYLPVMEMRRTGSASASRAAPDPIPSGGDVLGVDDESVVRESPPLSERGGLQVIQALWIRSARASRQNGPPQCAHRHDDAGDGGAELARRLKKRGRACRSCSVGLFNEELHRRGDGLGGGRGFKQFTSGLGRRVAAALARAGHRTASSKRRNSPASPILFGRAQAVCRGLGCGCAGASGRQHDMGRCPG